MNYLQSGTIFFIPTCLEIGPAENRSPLRHMFSEPGGEPAGPDGQDLFNVGQRRLTSRATTHGHHRAWWWVAH